MGAGQMMNSTIKDATAKRVHYDSQDELRRHLQDFVAAYSFGRRLKRLRGLSPDEFICKPWAAEPERFNANLRHRLPRLNT